MNFNVSKKFTSISRYGDADEIKELKDYLLSIPKENVNNECPKMHSYLHVAVCLPSYKCTKYLLECGADPNTRRSDGNDCPPLHFIIHNLLGEEEDYAMKYIKLLLLFGADPNVKFEKGTTVLHDASRTKSIKAIELLLNYGANPELINDVGEKPIDIARRYNNNKIIELFEEYSIPTVKSAE